MGDDVPAVWICTGGSAASDRQFFRRAADESGVYKAASDAPDIMLLDEPTNHLDLPTIEWLENYLKGYDKAVVIVSHDRMFLDKVADVTYGSRYHEMKRYPGNYTYFMQRKQEDLIKQEKDYEEQQKEIKRLTDWIEKWKNTPTKGGGDALKTHGDRAHGED